MNLRNYLISTYLGKRIYVHRDSSLNLHMPTDKLSGNCLARVLSIDAHYEFQNGVKIESLNMRVSYEPDIKCKEDYATIKVDLDSEFTLYN